MIDDFLKHFRKAAGFAFISLALPLAAQAKVQLAGEFGDHMVLQQGKTLTVRGTADPGEKVTVKIADQSSSARAGTNGQWLVLIAPLKASSKPVEFTVTGNDTIVLQDVLVGDVWVCSGQSNMEYSLGKDSTAREELPKANHPQIRLCRVSGKWSREPLAERDLRWSVCTPESAKGFSGVGYFFGRHVHEKTGVPIGLVSAAVSGTPAECWTSLKGLKSDSELKVYLDLYEANQARPGPTNNPAGAVPGTPAALFNGMIAPLSTMKIKGVLWYQGESNAGHQELYRTLFPALIADWRRQWREPDLPFLFVQLPSFRHRQETIEPAPWAYIREAQANALSVPNTGMAVTIDLGKPSMILHPPNKREIGRRLALVALAQVYGQKLDHYGPWMRSAIVRSNQMEVTLANVGPGLIAGTTHQMDTNQPVAAPGLEVKGFYLAGMDRVYHRAKAVIASTNLVMVSCDKVPAPIAVRYGWENNPEVNLYSKNGLPVAPFRNDFWPMPSKEPETPEEKEAAPE